MQKLKNEPAHPEEIKKLMYSAINLIKSHGFENIKARHHSNYTEPAKLQGKEKSYIPDITAKTNNGKHYFEIVSNTKKDPELISKWMLLSSLAEHRNGTFFLIVPHGKMSFTNKILEQHPINANILRLN